MPRTSSITRFAVVGSLHLHYTKPPVRTLIYSSILVILGESWSEDDVVSHHLLDHDHQDCLLFVYLGFYVAFNTVQVISRWVVGRAEKTSTYSSSGFCTVNCRPMASNYQISHLRSGREPKPRSQRWEARVLPLCHRGPYDHKECPVITSSLVEHQTIVWPNDYDEICGEHHVIWFTAHFELAAVFFKVLRLFLTVLKPLLTQIKLGIHQHS